MEPVLHILIPLVILLAFYPKLDKKYVFGLLFLTVLMDVDFFFPGGLHRFFFNNIFFILITAGLIGYLWNKKAFFVSLFYMGTHLIMDFAQPGNALFWPFSDTLYYITAGISRKGRWILDLTFNTLTREEWLTIKSTELTRWLAIEGFFVAFIVLLMIIIKYRKKIKSFFSKAS
jgi:hypothetical protein